MPKAPSTGTEENTRRLASRLHALMHRYRPSLRERRQEWLFRQMAGEPGLRSRLLRFIDVLAASDREIARPEATVSVPGQVNYVDWQTPRGVGFVVTDEAAPVDRLAGTVFGPLLAGNGLVVAPHESQQEIGRLVVASLRRAGVHSPLCAWLPMAAIKRPWRLPTTCFTLP